MIRPRVLLFDEPLSNLDAKLRVQMRQEIRDLQRRLAITTVYVTHDQEEAMAVSDRIAVMNEGSVVQEGTAEDLYHRPATAFVAHVHRPRESGARHASSESSTASGSSSPRWGARCALPLPAGGLAPATGALLLRPEAIALAAGAGTMPVARARSPRARSSARRSSTCSIARARRCRWCATTPGRGEVYPEGAPVAVRFAEDAADRAAGRRRARKRAA